MRERLGWIAAAVALALVVGGAVALRFSGDRAAGNELTVLVDGEIDVVRSVQDLMEHRVDWVSPKGHLAPAVPVSAVVVPPGSGRTPRTIRAVTIRGQGPPAVLRGADVALIDELLFRVDLSRGGTWQLHGRDRESSRRLEAATGLERVHKVERIEIESLNNERP